MKAKHFVLAISLVLPCLLLGQNLLVNGGFDDGLDGWTHYAFMDGSFEGLLEVMDDDDRPAMGSGAYLWMFCEGDAYYNQCIWQPVTVNVGDTLKADGAFKDLTDGELTNYWCELYLGTEEPIEDADYLNNQRMAFNWWTGCANSIDGTFQNDACVEADTSTDYWVVPDSLGEGEVTIWFVIKTGVWTDAATGFFGYEVAIDDLSLLKIGEGGAAVRSEASALPDQPTLRPNYPNPFNPSTTIRFELPKTMDVNLAVFDLHGREIQTLMHQLLSGGSYSVAWDGRDGRGNPVASGIYICRLNSGSFESTQRLVLIR